MQSLPISEGEELRKLKVVVTKISQIRGANQTAEENLSNVARIEKSFVGKPADLVQEDRKLIREGTLSQFSEKGTKPRWVFLFNDMIIIASNTEQKTSQILTQKSELETEDHKNYLFHKLLDTGNKDSRLLIFPATTKVVDQPYSVAEGFKNAIQLIPVDRDPILMIAPSAEEKHDWLLALYSIVTKPKVTMKIQCKNCQGPLSKFCQYCWKEICGKCKTQKCTIPSLSSPIRTCDECYMDLSLRNDPSVTLPSSPKPSKSPLNGQRPRSTQIPRQALYPPKPESKQSTTYELVFSCKSLLMLTDAEEQKQELGWKVMYGNSVRKDQHSLFQGI